MPKKASRSKLVKTADQIFSTYIRRRHAKHNDIVECFTCGKNDHWKKMHCGHFQSRRFYSTRWDETNCQIQCPKCNIFRGGEQFKFGLYLDKKFGRGTSEKLLQKASKTIKLSNVDIQEIISYYKDKVSKL